MLKLRTVVLSSVLTAFVVGVGCTPKYPNCKKDSHCAEGEYCVGNLCQQCRDSGDCKEGEECAEGACRQIDSYCTSSADCADGQICRENRCGPCLTASDCKDGKVCIDGVCGQAECRSDDDCPAGLDCLNYRCQPNDGARSELGDGDCALTTIYFEFDSSELSQEMRRKIEENYDCIKSRGGRVVVEGHTDPRGTTEYNMALGERRARVVSKVIETLGLEREKMRVVSKGEEEATGRDESSWSQDRKVEFR